MMQKERVKWWSMLRRWKIQFNIQGDLRLDQFPKYMNKKMGLCILWFSMNKRNMRSYRSSIKVCNIKWINLKRKTLGMRWPFFKEVEATLPTLQRETHKVKWSLPLHRQVKNLYVWNLVLKRRLRLMKKRLTEVKESRRKRKISKLYFLVEGVEEEKTSEKIIWQLLPTGVVHRVSNNIRVSWEIHFW